MHRYPSRRGRRPRGPRSRAARPERPANVVFLSAFLCLVTVIGLAFAGSGLELAGQAARTTATIIAVRHVTDFGLARTEHIEFTLRFMDRGSLVTERTDQIRQVPRTPAAGDRIQVYYVPGDPRNVTDVRYGRPGSYDFEMGSVFCGVALTGWAGLAMAQIRVKRRMKAAQAGPEDRLHPGKEPESFRDAAAAGPADA